MSSGRRRALDMSLCAPATLRAPPHVASRYGHGGREAQLSPSPGVDARSGSNNGVKKFLAARIDDQNKLFRKSGVDLFEVSPERHDYIAELVKFFRRRMMY